MNLNLNVHSLIPKLGPKNKRSTSVQSPNRNHPSKTTITTTNKKTTTKQHYTKRTSPLFFFFSMKHSACFLPVVRLCVRMARFSDSGFPLTRSLTMDFQLYRTRRDKQIMTLLLCGPSPSTVHCALCCSLRRLKTCKARVSVTEVFPLFFDDYLCLEDL